MTTELIPKPEQPKSNYAQRAYNDAEERIAHVIALRTISHGARTNEIGAALAAYRERIIARMMKSHPPATVVDDIRRGAL